ncbi:hypothetical protein [Rubripirellula lacrimiformis]|nr:hypothetical protein [Rubripirellula lacrimiformis]
MRTNLFSELEHWQDHVFAEDVEQYVHGLNRDYDRLAGNVPADVLVQHRLMRSLWAKQMMATLMNRLEVDGAGVTRSQYQQLLKLLPMIRTLVPLSGVRSLLACQDRVGDRQSATELASMLAEHADPKLDAKILTSLDPTGAASTRRGPAPLARMRPSRGTNRLDPIGWLRDPEMGRVEFVDGNPDHVRVRGIELRSGDIGIVELEHPGDGIFDSFLQQPGLAPHAMLYLSRRVLGRDRQPLIQPSLLEMFEGGWRTVPLTTALSPRFSWYSEWVRPTGLPDDIGQGLSRELDHLEPIAFDFQSRRIPKGGHFATDWGQPSASCTNLIRIPFERLGIELPYPTTEIDRGAVRNLDLIGLQGIGPIHTPTNMLNESGFEKVGIIDNAVPELAYAQAMVVGRPQLGHTFGGHFCQRPLILENLPNWKSIKRWKSAQQALLVKIGQSDSWLASVSRFAAGYTADEIPRTASPTAIAFYLRSDLEAGHLLKSAIYPKLVPWFRSGKTSRLPDLQTDPHWTEQIERGIANSALAKESWYGQPT